jgi:hypothetical protein
VAAGGHRADIKALQDAGATSLRAIADGLNAKGIPTARGNGEWQAVQVKRVLERFDPFVVGGESEASSVARRARHCGCSMSLRQHHSRALHLRGHRINGCG